MIKIFLVAFTAFLLSGCSTTVPYISKFRIKGDIQKKEFDSKKCKNSLMSVGIWSTLVAQ